MDRISSSRKSSAVSPKDGSGSEAGSHLRLIDLDSAADCQATDRKYSRSDLASRWPNVPRYYTHIMARISSSLNSS